MSRLSSCEAIAAATLDETLSLSSDANERLWSTGLCRGRPGREGDTGLSRQRDRGGGRWAEKR